MCKFLDPIAFSPPLTPRNDLHLLGKALPEALEMSETEMNTLKYEKGTWELLFYSLKLNFLLNSPIVLLLEYLVGNTLSCFLPSWTLFLCFLAKSGLQKFGGGRELDLWLWGSRGRLSHAPGLDAGVPLLAWG